MSISIEKLEQRIKELEDRLGMDSTNSSKPPSTDDKLKKEKRPETKKSKKKRGAQKGHSGNYLKISEKPDTTDILLPHNCTKCKNPLDNVEVFKVEKRQVYDLPEIKINISEYQAHSKICPCCDSINKPKFPNHIKAATQYGENIKSFAGYCNTYQMIPYERITQLIVKFTNILPPISFFTFHLFHKHSSTHFIFSFPFFEGFVKRF